MKTKQPGIQVLNREIAKRNLIKKQPFFEKKFESKNIFFREYFSIQFNA